MCTNRPVHRPAPSRVSQTAGRRGAVSLEHLAALGLVGALGLSGFTALGASFARAIDAGADGAATGSLATRRVVAAHTPAAPLSGQAGMTAGVLHAIEHTVGSMAPLANDLARSTEPGAQALLSGARLWVDELAGGSASVAWRYNVDAVKEAPSRAWQRVSQVGTVRSSRGVFGVEFSERLRRTFRPGHVRRITNEVRGLGDAALEGAVVRNLGRLEHYRMIGALGGKRELLARVRTNALTHDFPSRAPIGTDVREALTAWEPLTDADQWLGQLAARSTSSAVEGDAGRGRVATSVRFVTSDYDAPRLLQTMPASLRGTVREHLAAGDTAAEFIVPREVFASYAILPVETVR
jgi:hypothetical protein